MHITVNGESRAVRDDITALELLEDLGLQSDATVVECNGAILERATFGAAVLTEGDTIELVRFVGGG